LFEQYKYGLLASELEGNGLEKLVKVTGSYKKINYNGIIPLLVEKINKLETKIKHLENFNKGI
jgi:hypothetical protein